MAMPFFTSDKRNIISKVNLYRLWNFVNNRISFHYSKLIKRSVHKGMPVSISIEPTTACNLACPECPSGLKQFKREIGNIKPETYTRILDEFSKRGIYVNFYFQGEPFIHPQILEMVSYANSKKLYTAISTNAHFLTNEIAKKTVESGLDRLIVSVDGTTQQTYSNYRVNGELNKVIEGVKNIVYWKKELKVKKPYLIYQMLVVRQNENEIAEAQKLAKELGCDEIRLKTAQIYNFEDGSDLIPLNEKYSRYKKNKEDKYEIKNFLENQCWRMWQGCVFTWDGHVVPCCFDKDAEHVFGNINNETLKQIWTNNNYNNFRQKILKSRKKIDICKNCSEGTKIFN